MEEVKPSTKPPVVPPTGTSGGMIPRVVRVGIQMKSPTEIHKDPDHPETVIRASAGDWIEWDVESGPHLVDEIEVTGFWPAKCAHRRCKRPANPFWDTPESICGKPAVSKSAKPQAAGHQYKMTIIVKVDGEPVDTWDPHLRVDP